jgi:hypothetical protein
MEIGFDQGRPARSMFDPRLWEAEVLRTWPAWDRLVAARLLGKEMRLETSPCRFWLKTGKLHIIIEKC